MKRSVVIPATTKSSFAATVDAIAERDASVRHVRSPNPNGFGLALHQGHRREGAEAVQPLLSHRFNLTVEIPLKAVVRGHSCAIVPISWRIARRARRVGAARALAPTDPTTDREVAA